MKDTTIEDFFANYWAPLVAGHMQVDVEDFKSIMTENDTHNTDERTRENFKYGASIGIYGTPQAVVNGVLLDDYPADANAWRDLFSKMFAPTQSLVKEDPHFSMFLN